MKATVIVILALAVGSAAAANAQPAVPTKQDLVAAFNMRGPVSRSDRGLRPVDDATVQRAAPVTPATAVRQAQPAPMRERTPAHPPARPQVAVEQASGAQATEPQASVNLTVLFEVGSNRLTPEATRVLNVLGEALSDPALASNPFRIVGHTDSVGSREINRALSEKRAIAVADYIASRYRVARARLTTVGMGQDEPLVPTADNVAEPRNRRVQVIKIGE